MFKHNVFCNYLSCSFVNRLYSTLFLVTMPYDVVLEEKMFFFEFFCKKKVIYALIL